MPRPDRDPAPRRAILVLAAVLACAGLAVAAMLALLQPGSGAWPPMQQTEPVPGAAALQPAPQPELAGYQRRKLAQLQATGPIPSEPGWARIPIERAMDLLSERGLRATDAPADETGADARKDAP